MYWIISLFALAAICFIAVFLINNYSYSSEYDGLGFLIGCIGTCAAIVLLIMFISLVDKKHDFEVIKIDYENTKMLVENYREGDYGNMDQLTGKVIKINEAIAKHKAYHASNWTGLWYSEEIGALKPLSLHK